MTGILLVFKINKMAKIDVGKTFYTARTSKGIILEEVEKAIHIRLNYLLALEENRFHEIPALAYVKAYVRKYAEFLGLDPAPLLASIEDTVPASYLLDLPSPPRMEKIFYRKKSPLRQILLISGGGLLIFLLILFLINLAIPEEVVETSFSPTPVISSSSPSPSSSTPLSTSSPTFSSIPSFPSTVSPSPSPSSSPIVEVQVEAVNFGEIEVITGGKVQFKGELEAGQRGTWRGESFLLNFDDPANFRLFLEGEEIPLGAEKTFKWP